MQGVQTDQNWKIKVKLGCFEAESILKCVKFYIETPI